MKVRAQSLSSPLSKEAGGVLVLHMIVMGMLFAMLVIGYGLAGAFSLKASQESELSSLRSCLETPGFQMELKNSQYPSRLIAEKATSANWAGRPDEGLVETWFYEVPASQIEPDRRAWACEIVVHSPYKVPFGGVIGISSVDVTSTLVLSFAPYGEGRIWRPASLPADVWTGSMGSLVSHRVVSLDNMPPELQAEISELKTHKH